MSNSCAKFEVARFDGTGNFGLWQRRVNDLLVQQGLQKVLRATKPVDMVVDDWTEMQEKAAGLIRLCVLDEVMYYILYLKTPIEVWEKLESQYQSKILMNKLFAKQRLYSLKMQEGSDLQQHSNTFVNIITDLARLGVKVDDEDNAIVLLCSLPDSYVHLVTNLTYGKETNSLDDITAALVFHSQRSQEGNHGGDALYIKGSKDHGKNKDKWNSGKKKKSKSMNKKTTEYFNSRTCKHNCRIA